MQNSAQARRAYNAAAGFRSQKEQEADVFRRATSALKAARDAGTIDRIRALADNRRLWMTLNDLMSDPGNALPEGTRAGIISIGKSVHREMDQAAPDFEWLIAINETLTAGLVGKP
jgi:flagellar biosynthesis activator protein FlaF